MIKKYHFNRLNDVIKMEVLDISGPICFIWTLQRELIISHRNSAVGYVKNLGKGVT